jgi:sialidase-1
VVLSDRAGLFAAEPTLTHVDVFTSGKDGYHTFRIPAIVTASDGTLIAFAEGRKFNSHDPGFENNDIDLVVKRSTDNGKTWSELKVLDDPGERWSACNPAAVLDRDTGRVWVFHCRTKPGRSSVTSRPGTDDAQSWTRFSTDSGATWSEPIDLTPVARDVEHWGGAFFGPGGPIQDRKGRLIVPLSKTTGRQDATGKLVGGPWNCFAVTSDDHGRTWQRGELLPEGEWGNENQLVELSDGRILMDARQNTGPHRWLATSDNGGRTWSKPRPGQSVTAVACAIKRFTRKASGDDRDRILWTGPKGPGRAKLVVRVSYDEGETFTNERLISDEQAAYSDLAILKDGSAGVLWERGDYRWITFTRLDREFLEP